MERSDKLILHDMSYDEFIRKFNNRCSSFPLECRDVVKFRTVYELLDFFGFSKECGGFFTDTVNGHEVWFDLTEPIFLNVCMGNVKLVRFRSYFCNGGVRVISSNEIVDIINKEYSVVFNWESYLESLDEKNK